MSSCRIDATPSRPEREAGGDLPLPGRGSRQQQPGDVGAGNHQHDADGDERQVRETTQRVQQFDITAQPGIQPDAGVGVGVGIRPLQARRNRRELGARLFERRARPEPAEHLEP